MNQSELAVMANTYKQQDGFRLEFFKFYQETRVQLLTSQLQMLQSLVTIILAFDAIIVATNHYVLNVLWVGAFVTSLILLAFATSYIRESIDAKDKELREGDVEIDRLNKELFEIITSSKEKDDFSIFATYLKNREQIVNHKKDRPMTLLYTGEIAMALFYCSLFLTIAALVNGYRQLPIAPSIIFVLLISVILAFLSWSTKVNSLISRLLQPVLGRFSKSQS